MDPSHASKTNQAASASGQFEEESNIKTSMQPPAQLFGDGEDAPDDAVGGGGLIEAAVDTFDGLGDKISEVLEKISQMFGGGAAGGAAAGGGQGAGGPQDGGKGVAKDAAKGAVGGAAAAAKKDPPNKFVKVNDRSNNKISDAVKPELNAAIATVKKYTGVDIGTGFGDTTRNLGQGTKKVGADNFSWHKSGRAVDFDQGLKWVIAKDPKGKSMYFRLYLQANEAGEKSKYVKEFSKEEKAALHHNGAGSAVGKKKFIDVTAILEENDFTRIPAHKGWEKSYNKREWWHYVNDDGLTWYQAIRQIYTEEQIATAMKKLVVTRHASAGRLAREGFPPKVLKAIWDNKSVTLGKLSLYFSVGSDRNCANIPEDVEAAKKALIGLGIAEGNIATMITAYQTKKKFRKPDGYITVGGTTHKTIGGEMK